MKRGTLSAMALLTLGSVVAIVAWLGSGGETETVIATPVVAARPEPPGSVTESNSGFSAPLPSESHPDERPTAPPAIALRGLVVDVQNQPVARAAVEMRRPDDCPTMAPIRHVVADEAGVCELAAGRGLAVVARADGVGISEPLVIPDAAPSAGTTIRIVLLPRCLVTVTLPHASPEELDSLQVVGETLDDVQPPTTRCEGDSTQDPHWHLSCGPPYSGVVLFLKGECAVAGQNVFGAAGGLVDCVAKVIDEHAVVSWAPHLAELGTGSLQLSLISESGGRSSVTQSHPLELLTGLRESGHWVLTARSADCGFSPGVEFEVSDECRVAHVEVPVVPGARVAGRARWPSGEPATDVRVTIAPELEREPRDNPWPTDMVHGLRTDDEGHFEFPCFSVDRKYKLRFASVGAAERVFSFAGVRPGVADQDYVLSDDALCSSPIIQGHVIDAKTGLPLETFATRIQKIHGHTLYGYGVWDTSHDWVDGSGEFHYLKVDPSSMYWLQILAGYRGRGEWTRVTTVGPLSPGQGTCDLEIVVGGGATVEVSVADDVGLPVQGARVYLRSRGMADIGKTDIRSLSQFTNEAGRAQWADVASGWYWIMANTPASQFGGRLVYVAPAETIFVPLTVGAGGAGSIAITYRPEPSSEDAQAAPMMLELRRVLDDPWRQSGLEQRMDWNPDASGRGVVSGLVPGDYTVSLWVGDHIGLQSGALVLPGGVAEIVGQ